MSSAIEDDDSMRLRVLFLDDDPAMRRTLVRAAVLHSVHVTTVATEEEAWAVLATQPVDVTILDFHLGDDGQSSAQLASELAEGGHLALIWTGDPEHAREVVADTVPVLAKSSEFGSLFAEVGRLVRQRVLELTVSMGSDGAT